MKKVIIHIGTHKTGSTSIQNVLFGNQSVLSDAKIDYLNQHCIWSGHHNLGWILKDKFYDFKCNSLDLYKSQGVIKVFTDSIKASKADVVVLSSENLFEVCNVDKLTRFYKELSPFCEFEIVVYLRSQPSFLYSWYSELVTAWYGKITVGFDSFIKTPQYPADYASALNKWSSVFGEKSLKVFSFESAIKADGLEEHFFKHCLPSVNFEKINLQGASSHASLAPVAVEALRYTNAFQMSDIERGKLVSSLQEVTNKTKLESDFRIKKKIQNLYYESNKELENQYGIKLNSWFDENQIRSERYPESIYQEISTILNAVSFNKADVSQLP